MGFFSKLKDYFADDDEYEYVEQEATYAEPEEDTGKKKRNVVSLTSVQQSTPKVVLCEPRSYDEAQEIADHIVNRRAVIINLQRVDHQQAMRMVDFLSGTVYAVNGDIQKLGSETFLCTPDNVDVSGSITDIMDSGDEFDKGW
ncbi:cell division protein SepF [Ornithinibacillus gellani]|uniref:cell division protein SepF n=1 Tax=Ornithinibacillus gellani TaxID=2293253 RepID=UPI000F4A8961|nr:cell division protein SepF [Ornithinibacillus gellani]TQS75641.1 cell division protein SepF [Ornithinibacillus gellani]